MNWFKEFMNAPSKVTSLQKEKEEMKANHKKEIEDLKQEYANGPEKNQQLSIQSDALRSSFHNIDQLSVGITLCKDNSSFFQFKLISIFRWIQYI